MTEPVDFSNCERLPCRDFTANGRQLYVFCSIKNTVIDSETCGTGTEPGDVLETIDLQSFVDPVELKAHFWDMFVVDAFYKTYLAARHEAMYKRTGA